MNSRSKDLEKTAEFKRSPCPVASTLDILGDKWTLLVVRDLFMGKRTYGDFQKSPERIPTNILAERLKRLERAGIIEKSRYQERPVRHAYTLTAMGTDLQPVLLAMINWGNRHLPGTIPKSRIMAILGKANPDA